jgi:hypothetical protein
MQFLRAGIENSKLLSPEEESTIQRIANTLLASLLFFEPNHDEPHDTPGLLAGSIRCRLPHESQPTQVFLQDKLESLQYATATREEAGAAADKISSSRWEVLRDNRGCTRPRDMIVFNDDGYHSESSNDVGRVRMFRLNWTLRTIREDRPYCVVAAKLKGFPELVPISGFPATLHELKERWQRLCV